MMRVRLLQVSSWSRTLLLATLYESRNTPQDHLLHARQALFLFSLLTPASKNDRRDSPLLLNFCVEDRVNRNRCRGEG